MRKTKLSFERSSDELEYLNIGVRSEVGCDGVVLFLDKVGIIQKRLKKQSNHQIGLEPTNGLDMISKPRRCSKKIIVS